MKKALCFFMAIVFVCCVISHGKDERFSVEAMITNLTNFEEMPTFEEVVECWTSDEYYVGNVINMEWYPIYSGLFPMSEWHHGDQLFYYGEFPLAYDKEGNIDKNYSGHYSMMFLYDSVGNPYYHQFENGTYSSTNYHPVIRQPIVKYVEYEGDNEVLSFFSHVKGFFLRIGNCINLIFRMIKSVFVNLKYFLPWNNTVPRGEW